MLIIGGLAYSTSLCLCVHPSLALTWSIRGHVRLLNLALLLDFFGGLPGGIVVKVLHAAHFVDWDYSLGIWIRVLIVVGLIWQRGEKRNVL